MVYIEYLSQMLIPFPQDQNQVFLSKGLEDAAISILTTENGVAILTETTTEAFDNGAPCWQMWSPEKALEASVLHTTHSGSAAGPLA